jgi:hypothetical protein
MVIDKKALASVLFHSRPPLDVFDEIVKAQAESFKLGKIDFENRMSKLQASEARKICAPRQEVERLKAEYEDKFRDLNLRIQFRPASLLRKARKCPPSNLMRSLMIAKISRTKTSAFKPF